jgi:hypothetical protein
MTDKLKEDTVSADRKERIIFDPEAWRNSKKSGRKTSAITSRQNFDNEKFTRKAKEEQVDEGTIQPSGDSKVDSAGPTQSDTISQDKKVKKTNNPQIEFVTGTANPNGSSSTAMGGAQAMGRKVAESFTSKLINDIKEGKYAGLEAEDKPGKKATEFKGSKNAVTGKTVEGWKDEDIGFKHTKTTAVKEETDTVVKDKEGNVTSWKHEGDWKKNDPKKNPEGKVHNLAGQALKKTKQLTKNEETTVSKTYKEFLDQLLEYTPGPGGVTRVQGRSYGAQYHDPEGDDDADDKPKAKVDTPKRGRGRPAGSKSGANQKVTTGKSYGGIATHSLNLPNSNR